MARAVANLVQALRKRAAGAITALLISLLAHPVSHADEAIIASAANFTDTLEVLETRFEQTTPHRIRIVTGSTGQLFAQIRQGAPFDVFLAADADRPARLVEMGLAPADSRFTYAVGRLALWSPQPGRLDALSLADIGALDFRRLAIANPELAPYGRAAMDVLDQLDLSAGFDDRIVRGENIAQVLALAATGNADLAFIALAQTRNPRIPAGSFWTVPSELHTPIRQDAVLISRAEDNAAARAFLAFLGSDEARALIRQAGYEVIDE